LKTCEEVMEILEAFDLTGTLRGAAELAGCDHKTVAHWVRARDQAGGGLAVATRPRHWKAPFGAMARQLGAVAAIERVEDRRNAERHGARAAGRRHRSGGPRDDDSVTREVGWRSSGR
jgi:molybdenum-dependent DNA-binding transcriptional regulator ModE